MSDVQADPVKTTAPPPRGFESAPDLTVRSELVPDPEAELRQMGRSQFSRSAVLVVVVSGILLTFLVAFITMSNEQNDRNDRFDITAQQASRDVRRRYEDYVELLVGVRGLFSTGDATTLEEFDNYVSSAGLTALPGALAVGYAPEVAEEDVDDLEDVIHDQGYPEFSVSSDSESSELYPVIYLQPMEGNESAFGFDLGADEQARAAIDIARSTGEATLGPPVVVMGENGEEQRASDLFLPIYSGGGVPDSEELRNSRFAGMAFILLEPAEAMTSLFGEQSQVEMEIYDLGSIDGPPGVEPTARNIVFDSDGHPDGINGGSGLDQRIETHVGGHRWQLYVQPGSEFSAPDGSFPWLVLLAGLLITGLLAALIVSFAQTRKQAVQLADHMTANLRDREKDLRRANEDIVRSNKDLERYASIAAHDLQEPLRSLLAYASVLERRYGDRLDPEVLDQVQRMARAAERMRSLVVDLLAYARADSEQRKIEMVDLNEAIRIAIDDLSVLIHETDATIRVADLPRVPGNRRELIGVFSNLLSNALKYRSDASPEVIVVAHRRGDEWMIGVKDNGIGIAPAYHERIFELFRRLEKRSTDSGTGIGLAICVRTIAQHGGRIWVESSEGQGATFWFTLPADRSTAERRGALG
jgi:signal transduction histidine kinase